MKKYSFIISLLLSLLLFNASNALAAPGDFLFEFGDDYRLTNPRGVAVDGSGNVYVADTSNHRIQVFTASGTFLRKWGDNGSGDGQFSYPSAIAVDGSGNVYVADTSNHRIQVFTATGAFLMKWGTSGSGDGQFNTPYGIAVDGSGNVYVADTSNHRIQVFTATGAFLMKWGTSGSGDGQFNTPYGIAVDGSGNVYVADTSNHRIQVFTATGAFLRKWGTSGSADGQFSFPRGVAVDGGINIYVADSGNNRVQAFTATGAFLMKWGSAGPGDGKFLSPYGIAVDGSGNVYVADTSNHRIQVFTDTGAFLRKWGTSGSADGQFNTPYGIAVDGSGNVYVADTSNHRIQVFTATGAFLMKWGTSGSGDGQFNTPYGIAVDGSGNVYVADTSNHRIQVFTATGAFLRKWGAYGTGVGQFKSPGGVAVDGSGNVYVADTFNNRIQVFTSTGTFIAGWGGVLGSGNGQFSSPRGMAVDGSGNVYVADTNNHRIQVFTTTGAFLTKWGTSGSADGQVLYPHSIVLDGNGNVYAADTNNHRIQVFTTTGTFVRKWGIYGSGNGQFKYPRGIAADGDGNVYVADTNNNRIQVFEGVGVTDPLLTDSVAPTSTISLSGTFGNNGWFISDVQVSLTAIDEEGGSGINNTEYSFDGINWNDYAAPFTISAEGITTIYYGSIDNAGNIETAKSQTIQIDKTSPTVSASALPAPNANGWNNTDVTVSFIGTDTLSGIDTCTSPITLNQEGSGQSAGGICTDKAGNTSVTATLGGINIDKPSPTGATGNGEPVADAGDDLTIQRSQVSSTTVQGTATEAVTCRWTETDVTGNILTILKDWAPVVPNAECPLDLSALSPGMGLHFLTLEAKTGSATSLDTMTLTIINSLPVANAGDDLIATTVEAAATVIHGIAMDFDGDAVACRWTETDLTGNVLSILRDWVPTGPNGECPLDLSALSLDRGTHTLTLTASDGQATSSDDMVLTINNRPPVANAGEDLTIPGNQVSSTTVQGTVTDADSAYTLTCRWTETDLTGNILSVLQDWSPIGLNGECPLNLGALSPGIGLHFLTLEANDGQTTSLDTMTLTVNNSLPNANAGNDITITAEEAAAAMIQGVATDFDGNELSCRWMEGTTVLQDWTPAGPDGECSLSLSGLALDIGGHTLTLSASDGAALSSDDMVLTINNTPPVANAGENITIASDLIAATTIQGIAADFDGNALSCRWMEGTTVLPNTPVGPNGECPLSLSALTLDRGTHTMTLEVNDGQATSSNTMILTINNSAPHAAPGGAGIYEINTPVILPGEVSDFDGDLLHYEWINGTNVLCSGDIQSVAGGTSVLLPDCVVSNLTLGTHTISLQVSDGFNLTDTKSVTTQIVDSSAPTLKPVANKYILWPPDHRMVDINIAANSSDQSGCPVVLNATITSNEPEYGLRGGDIGPDWTQPVIDQTTGMIYTQLRAERSGRGKGRIYTTSIIATDCSGNTSTAKVKIRVPHDKDNEERKSEDREERDRNDKNDKNEHDGDRHDRDD